MSNNLKKPTSGNYISDEAIVHKDVNNKYKKISDLIELNIVTGQEFETGRVIGGKKEYGKRISLGNLPNTTNVNKATGLSNILVTGLTGEAYTSSGGNTTTFLPLPYVGLNGDTSGSISLDYVSGNIRIGAGNDRSAFIGYATITYVKN